MINILVPTAGGAAAVCCIKSLRRTNYSLRIVATDANPLSAGLFLGDRRFVVPFAKEKFFWEKVIDIIRKERIDIIMPTSMWEMPVYAKHREELENMGVFLPFSDLETINTCVDKKIIYDKLGSRFPIAESYSLRDVRYPCLIKPRYEKGKGLYIPCQCENDLRYALSKTPNAIVQEYLPGTEYTIDVFSDLDKRSRIAVPRERIEIKSGITSKGRTVKDKRIQNVCMEIADFLGIRGPSCIQMKRNEEGVAKIIEINPRFGGTTIISDYAGVNIPKLILKMYFGEEIKSLDFKEITILRYWKEIFLDEKGVLRVH